MSPNNFSLASLQLELMHVRRFKEAEKFARKSLDLLASADMHDGMRKMFEHNAMVTLGEALCEQDMFKEGKEILESVLKYPYPPSAEMLHLRAQGSLALCRLADGNMKEARMLLAETRGQMQELQKQKRVIPQFEWFLARCEERLADLDKLLNVR